MSRPQEWPSTRKKRMKREQTQQVEEIENKFDEGIVKRRNNA
jgi:hypothetical protein